MKVIWILFAWNPTAGFMQPVLWFPTEYACRYVEFIEGQRHWKVEPPKCGAVAAGPVE